MSKPPRRRVDLYKHKRWHIVPWPYRGKRQGYFVYRFGLIPEVALCADVALDGLNREGRESLICGAFFEQITHKEGMGLCGTA